jgi:hypothetical protein
MSPAPGDTVASEVLIDLDIDLLTILIRGGADDRIGNPRAIPLTSEKPAETRGVETVNRDSKCCIREVISSGHLLKDSRKSSPPTLPRHQDA